MEFKLQQQPYFVRQMVREFERNEYMNYRLITATARLPEEHLEAWRKWIKEHDGNVVVPREKEENK